jgi:3-oxo-5-alpha-steroid 4-dehydrogenase 1
MSETLFYAIVYIWIFVAIGTYILLQKIIAPFGRHTRDDFGPTINARLGWFLMEIPSPLIFSLTFLIAGNEPSFAMWVFFLLWNLHYINRSLIYPFRQKDHKKRMPVAIMYSAIGFNIFNGFLNGYYFGAICDVSKYGDEWLSDSRFVLGLAVFIIGMFINWQSDNILLSLRKPGETAYKIPLRGLFRFVSCPNLFGEMVEWTGFAIMVWSAPALSFAIWTLANLLPRAMAHHEWYLKKFGDEYPKDRKAVIPFVL